MLVSHTEKLQVVCFPTAVQDLLCSQSLVKTVANNFKNNMLSSWKSLVRSKQDIVFYHFQGWGWSLKHHGYPCSNDHQISSKCFNEPFTSKALSIPTLLLLTIFAPPASGQWWKVPARNTTISGTHSASNSYQWYLAYTISGISIAIQYTVSGIAHSLWKSSGSAVH